MTYFCARALRLWAALGWGALAAGAAGAGGAETRPWQAMIQIEQALDTNARLTSFDRILSREQLVDRDWVTTVVPALSYRFYDQGAHLLGGSASLYSKTYVKNADLDLFGVVAEARHTWRLDPFILYTPLSGGWYAQDRTAYALLLRASTKLVWQQSEHFAGAYSLGLERLNFLNDTPGRFIDPSLTDDERSSFSYTAAIEEWFLLGPGGRYRLKAGLELQYEDAHLERWSADRLRPYVALNGPLPWKLDLTARMSYMMERYRVWNDFFSEKQKDDEWKVELQLRRPFPIEGGHLVPSLGVSFTRNQSNVALLDFKRLLVSAGLELRF